MNRLGIVDLASTSETQTKQLGQDIRGRCGGLAFAQDGQAAPELCVWSGRANEGVCSCSGGIASISLEGDDGAGAIRGLLFFLWHPGPCQFVRPHRQGNEM